MINEHNMENYSYEIIEALEQYYTDDIQTLLYCLKDLYFSANEYKYQLKLEQLCKDEGLCPLCFTELNYSVEYDNSNEYFGFLSKEPVYIKYCRNCGYNNT
jgi:hypothetical protein